MIGKLWRGEYSLVISYWLFGVLGSYVLVVILGVVVALTPSLGLAAAVWAGFLAYVVLTSVGIWRAAGKYTGPALWGFLARLAVVLGAISVAVESWRLLDRLG